MKRELCILLVLCLSGCTNSKITSDKVFTNAQVLYQEKEHANSKQMALQMPSYFLDLEYAQGQTKLSTTQIKKIDTLLKKLDYPDEYRIYASFGANGSKNQVAYLADILKRGDDLKKRYGNKVKKVKIVYLKNQRPDSVYIRLLG